MSKQDYLSVGHFSDRTRDVLESSNLTKRQLLIWVGQKLNPEVPFYNMIFAFTIADEIKVAHFQKAFQALIDSSDTLRTVIEEVNGIPQQRVIPPFPYKMDYLDFSEMPDSQAAFQTRRDQRCVIVFNLEKRLFDSALIKTAADQFIWYLNIHHIITDGWSTRLVYRRMAEFYERSLQDQLTEIPALPSFQDYIVYERAYRRSPQYKKAEAYWQQKLAEHLEPARFYGKAPLKKTTHIQRVVYDLGRERSQKLKIIAMQEVQSITLNLSLFNIFATLLFSYVYRVSGNRRLAIGVPFHNRPSQFFKETIGLFIEVCPLQIEIAEDDTFLSLLKKVMNETHEVLRYAQHGTGNPVHNIAYDVMLNYLNMSFPDFHGFSTQPEWVVSGHWDGSDSLALSVHDFDESGSFRLYFDFNCDVFDEEQRSQAIQHFLHILDGFIENRTQPISHVSLLSEEEKQRILVRFNQTAAAYPANQTIVRLFETQAQRIPDRVAVTSNGQALTYAHLNAKANQLARHLQQFGVGPDTLVAIYMDRSLEIVIGILGILKAGGAYVPLDPAYPQERLAFMLEDTLAPVLLTQQRLFESLPEHKAHTVCLDTDWEAIARESKENPVSKVTADNLAYVIYTSGSTGKPKGAMVQHKSLVNYTETASVEFALAPSDYVLQFASISFDAAAEEIFPCLARGATLILRTDSMLDSIPTFLQKCRDWALTVLDLPTAYWHELTAGFDTESLTSPPSLRLVIIGGEKALPEPLVVWQKHVGQRVRLVNTYGPTEATVVATMCELSEEAEANTALQEVPIGRAIRNVQLYVLNRYLQPVPIGVPGELHIGGVGLARGYLNRPELTAEKFIPNPFSNEPGTCLYKTGDLVRYLPDGNIEFLGRMDHQVKIRGFRVELGEIEVVLSRHPAVQEAVVLAREHGPGDKRLVAYVVPNQKQVPITRELRRFLKENLPDYMLPSAFVMLEKMPLTPNGKVDRSALPAPDTSRSVEEDYIAPRTPTEELLAAIWAEVLGLEQVGIRDNFFELGGNSLLATQVISRVYETFQMKLPLTSLFEKPTVGNLAESIETVRWAIQELQAPPSDMGDDQEEIEL